MSSEGFDSRAHWRLPLWRIRQHALVSHVGWRTTPIHVAAALTTVASRGSVDAEVQQWAAGHGEAPSLAWSAPGLIIGLVAPVALPAGLLLLSNDEETITGGAAALQAVAISFSLNTAWKAVTNRKAPPEGRPATRKEAREFLIGFPRQAPFDGWPSGHAMTNTAMGAALATYFHDRKGVVIAAYGWASYVMGAAALGNSGGVHWTSDVVAGGLMGWAIGSSVGRRFATRGCAGQAENSFAVICDLSGGRRGMRLIGRF